MDVSITVNGERYERDVEPRQLLVHFLRDTLELTGTHWVRDLETLERLWARHLVDQVAVDVEERGAIGFLAHEVRGPELFVEGAGVDHGS